MRLVIYPFLNLRSKRAMTRIQRKYGHYYSYQPRDILVSRLSQELSMTKEQIREQIRKERNFIIDNQQYY